MDYSNLQDWEINVLASDEGLTSEEWKAKQDAMGKFPGNTNQTPDVDPLQTPAGDSSSGDISLESPDNSRYTLSLEDIEGSEEDIKERLITKLRAVGIEIDEAIPFVDGINLISLVDKNSLGDGERTQVRLTEDRQANLEELNQFILEHADGAYADNLRVGREDMLNNQKAAIDAIEVTESDVQNWIISNWNKKSAEKQAAQMKATQGAPFGMTQAVSSELTIADFETEEEYNQYSSWKESGNLELSDEDLSKYTPLVLEEERNAADKAYVRSLSKEDREALETIAASEVYKIEERIENFENESKSLQEESEALQADIEIFNANPVSEEEANFLKARAADLFRKQEDLYNFSQSLQEGDYNTLFRVSEDLSKNYNLLEKLGVNFKKTAIDIGYGAFQVMMATGSLVSEGSIEPGIKLAEDLAKETLQDIDKEVKAFDEGVQFSRIGKDDNIAGNIINWAANTTVQAVPSLTLAFSGPAAMPLFFASGYGATAADFAIKEYDAIERMVSNSKKLDQYEQDPSLFSESDIAEIKEQMRADSEIVNLPGWKEMTTSAIAGAAEVAFERLGTMAILKGVNKTLSPIPTKRAVVKSVLKSANQEGLTEAATELTNNFAKMAILGEDVNIFDGVAESYFGGVLIGGPLELKHAVPAVYSNIAHEAMTREELNEYSNKIERLRKLTGIENLESLLNSRMPLPENLSEETKELIKDVQEEGEFLQDQAIQRLQKRLSFDQLQELGKINMQMRQINQRLIKAARSSASQAEISAVRDQLQDKFDKLSNQREELLTNKATQAEVSRNKTNLNAKLNFDLASSIVFNNELTLKKISSGRSFDLLEASVKENLLAESDGDIEAAKEKYFQDNNRKQLEEDYNRAQALNSENGRTTKIKRMTNAEFQEMFPEESSNTTAFEEDGVIYVNEDAAAARGQVGVYTHEMFHAVVRSSVGDGNANKAGEQLLQFLEKEAGGVYSYIKNKLDLLYKEGDTKDAAYYEEALTALSDYIAEGNTIELGALTQFNRFINKIFQKEAPGLSLTDGQQTFEFIVQYATKNRGQKAEEAVRNFVKTALREDEPEETDQRKRSSAAAGRAQAMLAKMQEEGYNPNSMELYEALQGMVGAQLSKFKNKGLQINDMEEAVADVVGRLYTQRDVNKFDGRGTLYGYLNGRISFRIKDAFKANPIWIENFGDVNVDELTGGQAKEIAVEAPEVKTQQPEAPQYKSLTQRRVLEPEVLETVKGKVLSNVRVLKQRLDAPVSKNVTVTPIIAEIKKVMGKQADIDFKKAMGGLKDGELRKYLLRNKAAILENMTTTWLMTAMPNAVQKQVNGVWTSDWKGKKIDRESVSTDNAGRTSGSELVRRLPKAATRMSDADFLSNFFTEDGKLIRGRKESLAKAMAEELTFEILKEEIANPDSEIGKAFLDNQRRNGVEVNETTPVEFSKQAERGNVKFSRSTIKIAEGNTTPVRTELDLELAGRNKTDSLLKENGFTGVYKFKSEEDVNAFIEDVKAGLLKTMPRSFFFPTDKGGPLTYSSKIIGASSKDAVWKYYVAEINKLRALPDSAFGKPIQGVDNFNPPSYKTLFKNEATVLKNKENGKIEAFNSQVGAMHSAMWFRFNQAIQENRGNARVIAQFLNFSTSNPKHPNRLGAQFVGYSKGFTEGKANVTFEHAMPNLAAYLYLLDASLNGGNFDLAYKLVMANYKLIALDKKSDEKLGGVYKTGMPKGWSVITGNWAERYFNPLVFENDGGIDPESIVMLDGRTLGETVGIKADGTLITEKARKFSKSVDSEQLKKDIAALEAPVDETNTEGLSEEFNNIIERKTGVEAFKEFSRIQAQLRGKKVGKFKFFIAPGADDFRGLVHYAFAGKGKQGEKDMAWFEEKLMTPYFKGIAAIDAMRQQIKRDFAVVKKQFSEEYKLLSKTIGDSGFTYDHAVRVYMWNRQGTPLEGLSKRDTKLLLDAIEQNPELATLADALLVVARREAWPDPVDYWEGGSVLADLNSMTEKIGRKKFLEEFIANADVIFNEENLNKVEALYGRKHRAAIEDSLYAMKNGTNRPSGNNAQINSWLNWLNGSTGAIMFFNRRSALLQMLSFTNFINWSDNNPMKAAMAFANQKQYWSDFAMIFNSDKLKERRGGLKQDVSDSELASVAGKSKNSPQAILAYLLKIGFTPTQIADSMAIATGGAMFYRNRVNKYLKEGMDQKAAEEQAFLDFSMKSDEAQQSSDPALVSQEQRSVLGRIILAFANTPMQYTRLMKKAAMDLKNGRGNPVEHLSKIAYYGVVQNFIFSSLQSAMFALMFDDDENEELTEAQVERKIAKEEQKVTRVINSMLDTILRGSGIYGAVAAVAKNTIMEYAKQEEKGFLADHAYTLLSAASISPPIQSKLRKLYSAIQTKRFEKDNVAARGWALTADGKMNLGPNYSILGNVLSATTNLPMDRVVDELRSVGEALDARNKAWQRIALALGWKTWDVGARNEEADLIKSEAKARRKKEGIEKAKETRRRKREEKQAIEEKQADDAYLEWERKFLEEQQNK